MENDKVYVCAFCFFLAEPELIGNVYVHKDKLEGVPGDWYVPCRTHHPKHQGN